MGGALFRLFDGAEFLRDNLWIVIVIGAIVIIAAGVAIGTFVSGRRDDDFRYSAASQLAEHLEASERLFWESIKDSRIVADYEAYIAKFPDGVFVQLALNRIADLQSRT